MRHTAVLKLGGSLLGLPDWPARFRRYLNEKRYQPIVVVGGGQTADQVRNWQTAHRFDDRLAHQLALQAIRFNAESAAAIVGGCLVATMTEVENCWQNETIPFVDVVNVLARAESSEDLIPPTWDATSDAIAAFVAGHWRIDRLVLLKSADLPGKITDADNDFLEVAAQHKLVDPLIAGIARHFALQVEWKNLRSPDVSPR